jgi:hypothetical protein
VAKEIWICDNASVTRYDGDISSFKMELRRSMNISGAQKKVTGIAVAKPAAAAGAGRDDN